MNQNEKELLDAYNSLSDQEAAKLKPEELTEYEQLMAKSKLKPEDKSQGFNYGTNNPEQQRDIATSLFDKVKVYGYSGLSDSDKDMFNKQYSYSQAARKGMSQKEVQDYADINASGTPIGGNDKRIGFDLSIRNPIEAASNVGQLVREGLSVPAGLIAGTASYAKDRMFNEGDWAAGEKPWTEYFKEALGLGSKSEGLAGVLADPANIVGAALPIAKSASFITRAGLEGLKGGGLAAISDLSSGNTVDLGRNIGVGALLGSGIGGFTTGPAAKQGLQEAEAIRTFPGTNYLARQQHKAGELASDSRQFLSDAEKKEILQNIPAPYDQESWIKYNNDISKKAKEGYAAVDEIAKRYKEMPGAEIPLSEIEAKMIEKMNEGVGTYSKDDVTKFVKKSLAGFKDKYGADGKVPVHELGMIKGKFSEDIFDPRFTVSEGTQTKRSLSKKAGSVVEDYRENRPAYMIEHNDFEKGLGDIITEALKRSPNGKLNPSDVASVYKESIIPYNKLLDEVSPGTKGLYRRSEILNDIFEHQPENVGSQRIGKGLLGKLFEGATHTYGPSGNAYKDPVLMLRQSKAALPTILGKGGVGIGFELGRDIDYSMRKKK